MQTLVKKVHNVLVVVILGMKQIALLLQRGFLLVLVVGALDQIQTHGDGVIVLSSLWTERIQQTREDSATTYHTHNQKAPKPKTPLFVLSGTTWTWDVEGS